MARQPISIKPSTREGQINKIEPYLYRVVPAYSQPTWLKGKMWKSIVRSQPIVSLCRNTLISNLLNLSWQIVPRDVSLSDEYKNEIIYYTEGLEGEFGIEYTNHVEWIAGDLLDIPFGGMSELGKAKNGKIMWIDPIDGTTLSPTLNIEYPVMQMVDGVTNIVYFPSDKISRVYMNARSEIDREGWGLAPPEIIYLAIEMLARGDIYYAKLLIDTPEAGILDLGDMSQESAENWVNSFRSTMSGIDGFKIPVLYEHTTLTKWIPFGRPPSELLYDSQTMKYAAIVCGGYGMSISDIGLDTAGAGGGDTMAGTIRQERRTRRTGLANLKMKITAYFNKILPSYLRFKLIDNDDEASISHGRAMLAESTALGQMIRDGYIIPSEARKQMIADGLITISIPEEVPADELEASPAPSEAERPGLLGSPRPPSMGGYGEMKENSLAQVKQLDVLLNPKFEKVLGKINAKNLKPLISVALNKILPEFKSFSDKGLDEQFKSYVSGLDFEDEEIQKSVREMTSDIADELERERWYRIELSEGEKDAVVEILAASYLYGVERSANQIIKKLYNMGKVIIPMPFGLNFNLTNPNILDGMKERSNVMIDLINAGTMFFIGRALIKTLRNILSLPQYTRAGIDTVQLMGDNNFIRTVVQDFATILRGIFNDRQSVISYYETDKADRAGVIAQYRYVGLSKKQWITKQDINVCFECINAEEKGVVNIDYEYSSVQFGNVIEPLMHNRCRCELSFVEDDLLNVFSKTGINIWIGD